MGPRAWVVTVVPIVALIYIVFRIRPAHMGWMEISGMVLAVIGFGLVTVARLQLRDSFSITPQARHLVTTGLYSRIRNPIYVFSAIGLAGLVLYLEKPIFLLTLLILLPLQIARARAESRVLLEKFGDEYASYKAKTWF